MRFEGNLGPAFREVNAKRELVSATPRDQCEGLSTDVTQDGPCAAPEMESVSHNLTSTHTIDLYWPNIVYFLLVWSTYKKGVCLCVQGRQDLNFSLKLIP